jgi:hypothetical protein
MIPSWFFLLPKKKGTLSLTVKAVLDWPMSPLEGSKQDVYILVQKTTGNHYHNP